MIFETSFTFWQRFYPRLIVGFIALGIMVWFAIQAGVEPSTAFTIWTWIIGLSLAFLGIVSAFEQARFRIW